MKYFFLIVFLLLILASVGLRLSAPDVQSEVPVTYWVTDPNPARIEQINRFHRWLIKNGHVKEVTVTTPTEARQLRARVPETLADDVIAMQPEASAVLGPDPDTSKLPMTIRLPICEMRTDAANRDTGKQVIQGVSGVAGDVMDVWTGAGQVQYFEAIGLIENLTEHATAMGFDLSQTFPALETELSANGEQYAFPCNVATQMLWVNRATFARFGLPAPPQQWTFSEFESFGKRFVDAANPEGQRRLFFFCNHVDTNDMIRSLGLSFYNETMTRCDLDDPRYAEVLELKYKWTYVDRLLPTKADQNSFDTASGYGGVSAQLFNRGNYAMLKSGRWMLIQLRKFGELDLALAEQPHGGFRNMRIGSRAAVVYKGGAHRDKARLFLAYLASADYNHLIVDDADALPPNPAYVDSEAYLKPPKYPNEWDVHNVFSRTAQTIAIGGSFSPYVLDSIARRHITQAEDAFMNDKLTAEEAGEQATARVNAEIERTLKENPALRDQYEQDVARQKKIDALRAQGKPVPLDWIDNPFHRVYYQAQGWAE